MLFIFKNKFIFLLLSSLLLTTTDSKASTYKIKIDYIKIDNSFQNWGKLKFNRTVGYDNLTKDGIPQNLCLYFPFDLKGSKLGTLLAQ